MPFALPPGRDGVTIMEELAAERRRWRAEKVEDLSEAPAGVIRASPGRPTGTARTPERSTGLSRGRGMSSVRPLTPEKCSARSSSTFWPGAPRTPTNPRGCVIMRAGPSFQATGARGGIWGTRRSPRAARRPRDRWAHHAGWTGGRSTLHGQMRRSQREIWFCWSGVLCIKM